jgi:pyruvate formate lyase activating enzyme
MLAGLISNIQKYSLHDGPGIRSTVFLKGCPLACAWCHNPENMAAQPQVIVTPARCVRCGACREVCPEGRAAPPGDSSAANGEASHNSADASLNACIACGSCVEACPTGARSMVGRRMSVPELLKELLADRIFYEDSGGGVTFSGGEPLRQPEFLSAMLIACRERGLHTAVDTCGFSPESELLAIAASVDLFLYDLKCMDEARHLELCGVPNGRILSNLRALAGRHPNVWIRVPIIPGVNDQAGELDAMASFVAGLPGVRQVNLLPYHRSGLHKFEQLGQECRVAQVAPPSAERMRAAAACFAAAGVPIKTGG